MKLKAFNKNTEKFGYPQAMEYNETTFNGHQLGIAICLQNNVTGQIEENYLSEKLGDKETRDFLLGELLHEKNAKLIAEVITQFDEERLVPKTIYYMPYFVEEHSRFKPTVINEHISNNCSVSYDIEVELIFVTEGLCRYITVPFKTLNVPMFELVNDLFECTDDKELEKLGIKWQDETDDLEAGYALDFYNEAGHKQILTFNTLDKLKDILISARMINISYHSFLGE